MRQRICGRCLLWLGAGYGRVGCDALACGAWRRPRAPAPREAAAAAARLEEAGAAWDEAITVIDEARKKQMTAPGLQEPAKKALATLDREWDGLAAHRDYPMICWITTQPSAPCAGPS